MARHKREGRSAAPRSTRTTRAEPAPPATQRRNGRPPGEPRTELGRWVSGRKLTLRELADRITEIATAQQIPARLIPARKTVEDAVGGRITPGPVTMLLVREATGGDVDLQHWVSEYLARG